MPPGTAAPGVLFTWQEEQGETEAEKAELAELDAEEARITAYLKRVDRAVNEALQAAGYHRPSRKLQWMKCHGKHVDVSEPVDESISHALSPIWTCTVAYAKCIRYPL